MPSQVVYQTNADWHDSYEAMVKNERLVKADMREKGLLWFMFRGNSTVFLLSPMGKLQVKWNDAYEKKALFRLLRNLLVPKPNEKLLIKPLRQQTWIEYPPPESFKLYWCDQATEFVLKKEPEAKQKQSRFTVEIANVSKAVEELRHEFRFFREPTLNEVALKSACRDSEALEIGLSFARCKPQSLEEAKWVAEKAINLAGWLFFRDKGELNPQSITLANQAFDASSMEALARAQDILKNYPEIVPEINVTELEWPDETKKKWVQVFGCEPPAPQRWNSWPISPLSKSALDQP